MATGFVNSFTQGEIAPDAWDRNDIQPVVKGCQMAQNWMIRVAGPLAKRRGFWDLGPVDNEALPGRLVPFRRSRADALMLLFQDGVVWVYQASGDPLLDGGGAQVSFASPYVLADLPNLRFKQIADVIYIRTATGARPRALQRNTNTDWQFNEVAYDQGPWRPENTDLAKTLTLTGTDDSDENPDTAGTVGAIFGGQTVAIAANFDLFDPAMVGARFRLRVNNGSPGPTSWYAGFKAPVGRYCMSNFRVYECQYKATWQVTDDGDGGHLYQHNTVASPPVHTEGAVSDGGNIWGYVHDGAGVLAITDVADARNATGLVITTVPLKSDQATSYWAEGAYSDYRGWPRAWPGVREERLVEGATASDLDYVDLTGTAGFGPISENFYPGTGTGQVLDIDAVRRRLGDSGDEILWFDIATYLVAGTTSGEHLIAGSVLDEPISPSAVVIKQLSAYGSADVRPAKARKGLLYVVAGGERLRELKLDTQQLLSGVELSVLAGHIGERGLAQLAWLPPDESLAVRLADGGLAFFTYHEEQQVMGWTSALLPGGWAVEDIEVLPGPGGYETLWLTVTRIKMGVRQRRLWLQSQRTDALFMDGAQFYSGDPVSTVGGLDDYEGETVQALADGAQVSDLLVTGGEVTLPWPANVVLVGLPMAARFVSLDLAQGPLAGAAGQRQRPTGAIVSLMTAEAYVSLDGGPRERVSPRTLADIPAAASRRVRKDVTLAGDSARENHLVIEDTSAYDARIYAIRAKEQVGG